MADSVFEPEVKRSLVWLQNKYGGNLPSIAIECKKTQEPRLSFDKVQEHQIEGLLDFEKHGLVKKMIVSKAMGHQQRFTGDTPFDYMLVGAGGMGFLLVNFRFTKKSPRKDIAKGTNRCFAVLVEDYVTAKEEALAEGKASLSYDWFLQYGIECSRVRMKNDKGVAESGWDLEPLLSA